ncbi:DUF5916 domain-containing protein [Ulvibacterium marinum]|uniref:DUF5916 domain-containing protein n=1 Tax=Ulvibacterium marinum TaxID=2419782 RepID=UPI002494017C|nr:DUF5916 domain-containing protein [Ulvibacterium marinum]
MPRSVLVLIFFLCLTSLFGQNVEKSFVVKYIETDFKIDGILDEEAWKQARSAKDFQQYFPSDSILAEYQTDIKMIYSATTLYIGIRVNTPGNNYVIPSLERDYRAGGNDNISLLFDTFNDGTNAFLFGMNPYGVRREALISSGGQGTEGFTTSWDVKWKGEAKQYDGYYTAEMAIPLTSFKFPEGVTKWRFQSYRFDMQKNETSVWYPIPQNQLIFNLAFMGDMVFEKPLGKSRTPLAIIPYINAIADKDYEQDLTEANIKVGGDAKVAIGNGLNLDITLNPDFSNVEVDDIFTNLTRFEISLPERRQFFVDNNDLFGSFGGSRDANPFFSRRIGIATDSSGNSVQNRIIGGVRLSGKLNENWRLGVLNIQTDENVETEIASNNNMMIALQKKVFARSNFGLFFINRQTFKDYDFVTPEEEYNRVFGIDYNLASEDNTWVGKFYAHKSFQPGDDEDNYSAGVFLGRNSRYFNVFTDFVFIDEDFESDLGFVPRKDIIKWATSFEKVFWPKKGPINSHSIEFFPIVTWRPGLDYRKTDHELQASWNFETRNFSEFGIGFSNQFIFLADSFDPTDTDGAIPLPGNQGYHFNSVLLQYESNQAKVLAFEGEATVGRFFNGDRFSIEGEATLRLQPKVRLGLNINYDKITLPVPFPSADLWLVSPTVNVTFNKSIFWSTIFQYSNQRDNLGINSRLQWRFAPLSDLFLVYNDNYFVNQFSPRFRSINLKVTYWLNI